MTRMKHLLPCVAALLACMSGSSDGATITLQRVGSGSVNPGSTVAVDIFVNDIQSPNFLRGYQVTLATQPLGGTSGTLTLAPDNLSGVYTCLGGTNDGDFCTVANSFDDCPSGGCSGPAFTDDDRSDWVFAGLPPGSAIVSAIPGQPTLGATLFDPINSVTVSTPRYLGTMIFQASAGAIGTFEVSVVPSDISTFLIDRSGFEVYIPFTTTPITIDVATAAANDDCADAVTVFDGVTGFNTQNTTTDGPSHPGSGCDAGGGGQLDNDIWFNYTATCNGVLTVSTCGDATFDTRVAVYDVCSCPVSDGDLLSCSDNASGCGGGTSEVTIPSVTQGSCYKIRVGGTGGVTGTGDLTVACVPNDTCATARSVAVPSSTSGATIGATVDAGLPSCQVAVDSPGVWYTVTGNGGVITASLCGAASYDTRLTVFQGACGSLSCVRGVNNTCGNNESVSWCSTSGTPYRILVHGAGGADGTFTLSMTTTSCNDANACTTDSCSAGVCSNTPTFQTGVQCCNPSNGVTQTINDANPCTTDTCNASNGQVSHAAVPNGPNAGCDDQLGCTVDECFNGACRNTDVEDLNISCTDDSQCPGDSVCGPGVCVCGSALELVASSGSLPVEGCYAINDQLEVRVNLAFVSADTPIIAAQFFLAYDAASLNLVSIEPGQNVEPTSGFTIEINETVDPVAGTIDYLTSVNIGEAGVTEPTTVAVAVFDVVDECEPFVVFRASGPNGERNLLSASGGIEVVPGDLVGLPSLSSNDSAPVLSGCPGNMAVSPDPGSIEATVSWAAPTASDSCDGVVTVDCVPASGSAFGPGTTPVTCSATNSCGLTGSCGFNVTVEPPTLTADLELSPTVAVGPFTRCIRFEFWDCDAPSGPERNSTIDQNISFVGGQAVGVTLDIPGGGWDCVTARDPLHTLRSTATDLSTVNGVDYTATFTGPRSTGGHWLVGGNLNGDNFIDVLDFSIFVSEFLSPSSPNTPCGTPAPDGNVNGDNVVDLVDFVFVQVNSFIASEPNCCPSVVASAQEDFGQGPIQSISVRELQRRGLYHLAPADLNLDGVIDEQDIAAFMNGARPSPPYAPPTKDFSRDRSLRGFRATGKVGR